MSYEPQLIANFGGGLNLRDKADTVAPGQAIDALNVLFTERGALKQRVGTAKFTANVLGTTPRGLKPFLRTSTSDRQLMVGGDGAAYALNTSGAIVTSGTHTGTSGYAHTFERFGSPGNEYAYAGNGYDPIARWSGSAWTAGTSMATVDGTGSRAMPKARSMAVMANPSTDRNLAPRMAVAGFETATGGPNGTTSSPSHVYFSEVGTAESWNTSNYIQLSPGDGEEIVALVPWRGFIFAFKQTKFFVFYGESLDSSNNPIFNYRVVDNGQGISGPYAVTATQDGVYFANENGVFRTTGGDVERVSDPVAPIFRGDASSYWRGGTLAQNKAENIALGFHRNLLYVSYTASGDTTNNRTLVFHPQQGWWTLYDFDASSFAEFRIGNETELVFTRAATTKDVIRHSSTYTSDYGTAITARWRSGWFDFGVNSVKSIRQAKVYGAGTCELATTSDYTTSSGISTNLDFTQAAATQWGASTWGGGEWEYPAEIVPRMVRLASRGAVFSTVVSNSAADKTFQISRIAHHLRATRILSVRDTEELT